MLKSAVVIVSGEGDRDPDSDDEEVSYERSALSGVGRADWSKISQAKGRNWEGLGNPPFLEELPRLRDLYETASPAQRKRIADAGLMIRQMERDWPRDAAIYVNRIRQLLRDIEAGE